MGREIFMVIDTICTNCPPLGHRSFLLSAIPSTHSPRLKLFGLWLALLECLCLLNGSSNIPINGLCFSRKMLVFQHHHWCVLGLLRV